MLNWPVVNGPNQSLRVTASISGMHVSVHGKLEDKVTPSKQYLEKKLPELENGEFSSLYSTQSKPDSET